MPPRQRGRESRADRTHRPARLRPLPDLHRRGWSERGLLRCLAENDPAGACANFRRFGCEGVTTFNARSDYIHTVTLPNRMTLSTRWPVLQPTGQLNTVHHFPMNH